jgi:hypothetical protein
VVAALVVAGSRKRTAERNRRTAQEIRQDAEARAASLPEADREAQAAQQRAAQARAEAERAEREAAEAAQARDMEQAAHEDRVREADRLDPDVDHRDPAYAPETAPTAHEPEPRFDTQTGEPLDPEAGDTPGAAAPGAAAPGASAPGAHAARPGDEAGTPHPAPNTEPHQTPPPPR